MILYPYYLGGKFWREKKIQIGGKFRREKKTLRVGNFGGKKIHADLGGSAW